MTLSATRLPLVLPDASVTAPLLLAAVLLLSGIAKIVRPDGAADAFEALGVPAALRSRLVVRAHPWVEIVLGLAVVLLPTPWSVVAAVAALLLLAAYLVLVVRAVSTGEEASCNCFGGLGSSQIDGWTVARNVVFVVLAGVALWDLLDRGSVLGRLADLGGQGWWLLALLATAAVVALVLRSDAGGAVDDDGPQDDYLRLPTPDVPVQLPDGSDVSLRELSAGRAQLLLFLSPGCGPCLEVTGKLPAYTERLPELDLRVVTPMSIENVREMAPDWPEPQVLTERGSEVAGVFGIFGRPAAVLLGGDGLLAGGPVNGSQAIDDFVEDIEAELAPVREPASGS